MRKLVFHFFISKDWKENIVYNIHFNCLNYYKDCFDEAYFALSFEDMSDSETIKEVKEKLSDIFCNVKKIEFEIVENTALCECLTFKREIADKLGEDDLVFFGHSKGTTNVKGYPDRLEDVYRWVCGLYYFSLNEEKLEKVVTRKLVKETKISVGSYLYSTSTEGCNLKYGDVIYYNKYQWHYSGTFFWINSKHLADFIRINKVELPLCSNRFYAELFLGNIFPMNYHFWGDNIYEIASSYKHKFYYSILPATDLNKAHTSYLIDGEEEEFNNFVAEMLKP